ncbi:hypothetical protein [Streptomyces sp. TLI_185]|uniref:hypothetical protein n=1 Tax=Streptomyces sp. TLI_185 TaxID=2485151 RepID=UPI000F515FCF|nr:hypothetical protein [Streptomyces sp. TLI_185]
MIALGSDASARPLRGTTGGSRPPYWSEVNQYVAELAAERDECGHRLMVNDRRAGEERRTEARPLEDPRPGRCKSPNCKSPKVSEVLPLLSPGENDL